MRKYLVLISFPFIVSCTDRGMAVLTPSKTTLRIPTKTAVPSTALPTATPLPANTTTPDRELSSVDWQHFDIDGDGAEEYLKPNITANPSYWDVYVYEEDNPIWLYSLDRAEPHKKVIPDVDNLPPLGNDLYIYTDAIWQLWPADGGPLEEASNAPKPNIPAVCDDGMLRRGEDCMSPNGQYQLINISEGIEGSEVGLLDFYSGIMSKIPDTGSYLAGQSEFGWDPESEYFIHARSDGSSGLFRIRLPEGGPEILLSMGSDRLLYGATQPHVLQDDSILFVIQSGDTYLYPPNGVYRFFPNENMLHLLSDIPPLAPPEVTTARLSEAQPGSGRLYLAPNGTSYFYLQGGDWGSGWSKDNTYRAFLVGDIEGEIVWDLLPIFGLPDQNSFLRWASE
jgi:hypothetical protein